MKKVCSKRKLIVDDLIQNRGWSESNRLFLYSLNSKQLHAICVNNKANDGFDLEVSDMGAAFQNEDEDDEDDEDEVEEKPAKKTKNSKNQNSGGFELEAWLNQAPDSVKAVFLEAQKKEAETKNALVSKILETVGDTFTKDELEGKTVAELSKLEKLAVGKKAAATQNADQVPQVTKTTGIENKDRAKDASKQESLCALSMFEMLSASKKN